MHVEALCTSIYVKSLICNGVQLRTRPSPYRRHSGVFGEKAAEAPRTRPTMSPRWLLEAQREGRSQAYLDMCDGCPLAHGTAVGWRDGRDLSRQ